MIAHSVPVAVMAGITLYVGVYHLFIYLRRGKRGGWQLLRAAPFGRLSLFRENKRFGFKDQDGKVVVKAVYDDCYHFSEGLAPVASGGKLGVVDARGQVLVEPQYGRIQQFSFTPPNLSEVFREVVEP